MVIFKFLNSQKGVDNFVKLIETLFQIISQKSFSTN